MAIIKAGPIIGDIRGSVGGQTFSRNRFGAYSRQRVVPVNPSSDRQNAVRVAMNQLQVRFRTTLTAAQQDGWRDYAQGTPTLNRLGDTIHMTAINAYIRGNVIKLLAGETPVDAPPTTPGIAAIPILAITGTAAGGVVCATPDPVIATGALLQFRISGAKPFTVNYFSSPFVSTVYADDASVFPLTLVAAAATEIGQRYFVKSRYVLADGRSSNDFLTRVDITA
jgi:hypothetical protein